MVGAAVWWIHCVALSVFSQSLLMIFTVDLFPTSSETGRPSWRRRNWTSRVHASTRLLQHVYKNRKWKNVKGTVWKQMPMHTDSLLLPLAFFPCVIVCVSVHNIDLNLGEKKEEEERKGFFLLRPCYMLNLTFTAVPDRVSPRCIIQLAYHLGTIPILLQQIHPRGCVCI